MASPPHSAWSTATYAPLKWSSSPVAIATIAAIITATVFIASREVLWPRWARVLRSPLKTTLPHMRKEEIADLVYQPDHLPGARDVETPYGSIRVYEFGPEDGHKVLFVHGITTSCVTLTPLAKQLVKRGCRVMLFDLFGRGFSDGVGDLPHDERLYVSQILLVLASSPLSWTGDNAFRLVGYSLGGGIAAHFAATYPRMVDFLVLLAPAGLIRAERFGRITRFVFSSGVIPERILARITSQRLQTPLAASSKKAVQPKPTHTATARADIAAGELGKPPLQRLEQRVTLYVRWMVRHHIGFVPAFMSCIRHAPLTGQHSSWKQLAKRKPGTTAVILAEKDEIINRHDYELDGLPLLGGKNNISWTVVPGTHDFVMTHVQPIMNILDQIWDMTADD